MYSISNMPVVVVVVDVEVVAVNSFHDSISRSSSNCKIAVEVVVVAAVVVVVDVERVAVNSIHNSISKSSTHLQQ